MYQNFPYGLSAAVIGAAAIVFAYPQVALPQTMDDRAIAVMAKKVTVVINGQNPGSGVIIGKDGNTYSVLTAKHVVATPDEYQIVTSDGQQYLLEYSTVRKLPDVDLAVVQFTSNQNYPVAEIGNSDAATEGATIYISGWPHPGQAITQRIFQITQGKVSGRSLGASEEGYELVYTNVTQSGMSGGPVFDAEGRLIGIHGRAEGQAIYNSETGDTVAVKSGFNLGISLKTYVELTPAATLSQNPSVADPLATWGTQALMQKNLQQAIAYYEKALSVDARNLVAVVGLGQVKYEMGDISGAIRQFQEAIEIDGEKVTPQLALAVATYASGDRDRGLEIASTLFQSGANRTRDFLLQSIWSDRLKVDAEPILAYYEKTDAAAASEFPAEFNIGQEKYQAGDISGAIGQFQAALDRDRSSVPPQLALAAATYAAGDRQKGLAILSAALQSDTYYHELGNLELERLTKSLWSDRLQKDTRGVLAFFTPTTTITHPNSDIESVAIAPDGQTIVSSGRSDTIKLWDISTQQERRTLTHSTGSSISPVSIAISPDGKTLASGDSGGTFKLWNLTTGEELFNLQQSSISCLAFSPDGKTLAVCSGDLDLWDVSTQQKIRTLETPGDSQSVAFSPDGQTLADASNGNITVWNVNAGQEIRTLTGHPSDVTALAISPDGRILASGGRSNPVIKLWDLNAGKELLSIEDSDGINSLAISPDGKILASGSPGRTIKLWNLDTGEELLALTGGRFQVNVVAFTTDGQMLISAHQDEENNIKFWQLPAP